jgi:allantoinase
MVHALRSRRVITPHGEQDATVVIDNEHIVAVKPPSELSPNIQVEDLGDLALLPGLIDVHTHINEPGRTEWEGFATATRAAAAGGFTTLVDMPLNCLPETTNIAALELKREASRSQCMVDYALWGGCVDGNQHQLEPLALAGVAGFKCFLIYPGCDGFTAIDRANLERALPHIVRTGLPLLVHAELEPSITAAVAHLNATGADWRKYSTYLASRPDEAELAAIEMLLELCRQHRFRLHIVHLSTAKALPLLAAAKHAGLPVTVETCPHFLHVSAEDIPNGETLFKCAPPIRGATNREQLWQALRDGIIDLIATDHSPCPPHMKRLHPSSDQAPQPGEEPGRFDLAWGGIASLSTALSVLWTECMRREIPLAQLSEWTSAAPARLAGLSTQVGSIEPGKHANLVAFDSDASFVLSPDMLHYRHKISPYMGETLRGLVRSTWLRGQRVFTRGMVGTSRSTTGDVFAITPPGREYAVSCSLTLHSSR